MQQLDWLTDRILASLARDEPIGAAALQFLLRRFAATGLAALEEPLGAALAQELDRQARHGCEDDREGWLATFSEAAAVSDDPRLPRAAAELLPGVRRAWSGREVGAAMRAIDACLVSVNVPEAREMAAEAVDALERVVQGAYRPGMGMSHEIGAPAAVRGGVSDHVSSATALLTAYMLAARLPYAMLADELMQSVLRAPDRQHASFALNCETARVFCRLASLHRDDEYREKAVLPAGADYAEEASRMLASLGPSARERGVEAAPWGLALAEWLNLQ